MDFSAGFKWCNMQQKNSILTDVFFFWCISHHVHQLKSPYLFYYILNCKRNAIFFKIGIRSRKRLKLKSKCPRYDDNSPELYLLKKKCECLLTTGCCINTSSKTANLIMLEWFIENVCQISVIWEGVIINSRKPLNSMVFCNYQASLSIWKFMYPDQMTNLAFMLELSIKFAMSIWMGLQY